MIDPEKVTYFAETDARNKRVPFGIKSKDRLKHVYVIGKTGMGKSTMLENMAVQDIQSGEGMCFVDPHGKSADLLLEYVPKERIKDIIYFAPFDIEYPISFNVMEDVGADKRHLVANGLMSAFKKVFGEESFSDRMQYILQNTILALLEYPDSTMLGINKMLADKSYRDKVIDNITDPSVRAYWTQEYANYTDRFAAEAIPAIQNKIGQFTSNPLVRNIIGQEKSSFNFRDVMDQGKIVIINLSKGRVGEQNANLLGSIIITKIYLSAMSRADTVESELQKLPNFYLYVDEFQSFANESFADILSEARKYKLNLTIAHQYIEQMSEEVRAAVFGNVGTMISFRVGAYDAEVLEKEFAPTFTAEDMVNLGSFQVYLKLMINGVSSQPFSAVTLPSIPIPEENFVTEVIATSREQYAKPKDEVEQNIRDWHGEGSGDKNALKSSSSSSNSSSGRSPKSSGAKSQSSKSAQLSRKEKSPMDLRNVLAKVAGDSKDRKPKAQTSPTTGSADRQSSDSQKPKQEDRGRNPDQKPLSALSLKDLDKNRASKDNQREPSKENIASLKDALKEVVGKEAIEKPREKKQENKMQATQSTNKAQTPQSSKPNEIPEAELRKILDVE